MREFELAAELYCFMKELGAEDNFLLMSASQHNLAVRAAGERVLESATSSCPKSRRATTASSRRSAAPP